MPQQLPQHKSLIFCLFPLLFVYSNFAVKKRRMGKTSFYMKLLLPLAFVMSAVTGIGLHIAGHGTNHEAWHIWNAAHVAASLLWLASVSFHVKRHRYWYKSLARKGIGRKSKTTLFLSATFLTVTVTGIMLLAYVSGANSGIGLWHYRLGILLTVLSLVHAARRR